MRIAVSSSPFRRPLAAGELTQLEWVEHCASVLGVDGIVADLSDFPRTDGEYVAQLRKVAVDLGIVPFGIDAPTLLDPTTAEQARDAALLLASTFGAAIVRAPVPPPGEVPPATFVATAAAAKGASKVGKRLNVTLVVPARPGTLADDAAGLRHLLKDVDSAWLRACPRAADEHLVWGTKDRFPTFEANIEDDPQTIVARAARSWLILDAPATLEHPWERLGTAIEALRAVRPELRVTAER
ncbi:MAG TPA: hypothetical protein VE591_14195 [Candidatus Acidoferrum sp.]|nr:hypothetical protein [Candidatus Acidoferrum sp.]